MRRITESTLFDSVLLDGFDADSDVDLLVSSDSPAS
jgi:predicted nucleotidyltransferase